MYGSKKPDVRGEKSGATDVQRSDPAVRSGPVHLLSSLYDSTTGRKVLLYEELPLHQFHDVLVVAGSAAASCGMKAARLSTDC